jgi:RNA polymerase sigma-70 factor (ECF subfamily)
MFSFALFAFFAVQNGWVGGNVPIARGFRTSSTRFSLIYTLEARFMVDDRSEEERVEAALVNTETEAADWLETIYREDATVVLQAAYRVTGSAQDAEDVLQTVFTRLAKRDRPPDFSTGSRAYLRRAATNAALDIVQSRYVRSGVSLEVTGEDVERDPGPAADRQHHGKELQQQLRRALSKISRRGAEIFALRYFEGLDNTEIAEQLGTSTNTIAVTLHRTKARLKDEMAPFMGGLQ